MPREGLALHSIYREGSGIASDVTARKAFEALVCDFNHGWAESWPKGTVCDAMIYGNGEELIGMVRDWLRLQFNLISLETKIGDVPNNFDIACDQILCAVYLTREVPNAS